MIMPVKTAGVFSIRGATLSHKQVPYCSLCWHQPPNQHNNKACIFDETFRSQTKKISSHSRRELNYFEWLHIYSTEKKHIEKVGVCQMKLHISLLSSYLFMCLYWKLALKMHLVSEIRWNISCLTEVLLRSDCHILICQLLTCKGLCRTEKGHQSLTDNFPSFRKELVRNST